MATIDGQPVDTTNRYFVGARADKIVVMNPPHEMTKSQALVFAAWIATLADDDGISFDAALAAVQNT